MSPAQRTAVELYRDLLRLVRHIAPGASPKALALRATVRAEYDRARHLTEEEEIEARKGNAVRALSNYMLYAGGIQDGSKGGRLGAAMDKFHEKNVRGLQKRGAGDEVGKGESSGERAGGASSS